MALCGQRLRLGRCGVHEHAGVLVDQSRCGAEDDGSHQERGDGVTLLKPGGNGDEAGEDGDRAGHVPREVKRVRPKRRGPVLACAAQ